MTSNPAYEAVLSRRSVRRYSSRMPDRADLEKIAQAGLYAASGKGGQSSVIVVVTDRVLRDRLMEMNRRIGGWAEGFDPFYGAPAVLIVLGKAESRYSVQDGSLCMGNLMQAAHALGLGSCWINRAYEEFETEEGKAILRELGIEGEYVGVGHCIVGFAEGEEPKAAPRAEGRLFWAE